MAKKTSISDCIQHIYQGKNRLHHEMPGWK
jgi:hypothetical protein